MEKEEKRIVFLKGKKMILRPLRKDTDLEAALRWVNDGEVTQYLSRYLPMSFAEESEWFDNLSKRRDDMPLAIENKEGIFIGIVGLHNINWKDRTTGHGIFIGEKDYWEKGCGTDVEMTLLDYAFNKLNLRKIRSEVLGFNKRSLNFHLKCGYKIIGIRRKELFKNGRYCDLVMLEVFKKDWLMLWKKYQNKD